MPCRYIIDAEQQLVIGTAWDRVTFAEVDAHQDRFRVDRFPGRRHRILGWWESKSGQI